MANKLFITNTTIDQSFAETCRSKYSEAYFNENGWETKYFTDDWYTNLEKYDVILIWSLQQSGPSRHLKKECLLKLITAQDKHKYKILDYIEDVHNLNDFYNLSYEFYEQHFSNKSKNYIVVRYENTIDRYFPNCNCFILPYSIDHTFIPPFNQNPINELLLSGFIEKPHYPMRYKILELTNTFPIYVLNHPSYGILQHNYVGKLYLEKINEYITAATCCASQKYNYVLAKYFEIPATGSLLFAYVDPVRDCLKKYGFEDMVNMISFNEVDLVDKITYILDPANREIIDKIRLNGYNLIMERHTHNTRFNIEFDKFINELLDQNH